MMVKSTKYEQHSTQQIIIHSLYHGNPAINVKETVPNVSPSVTFLRVRASSKAKPVAPGKCSMANFFPEESLESILQVTQCTEASLRLSLQLRGRYGCALKEPGCP